MLARTDSRLFNRDVVVDFRAILPIEGEEVRGLSDAERGDSLLEQGLNLFVGFYLKRFRNPVVQNIDLEPLFHNGLVRALADKTFHE